MQQPEFQFETTSPINVEGIKGQNKRLYDYLASGHTITMFEANLIGVGYLNSRISDLRNKCGIYIFDRLIEKHGSHVKEYSLTKFE